MTAAAMTSFDSLSDEMALKIIAMAAPKRPAFCSKYDHDFLVDVLCKVSARFRRLATDSSLWKDSVCISIPPDDFSMLDFVIRECLKDRTKHLRIWSLRRSLGPAHPFPKQYLTDLATMFPNLKRVTILGFWVERLEDIPAPWNSNSNSNRFLACNGRFFERD